MASLVGAVDDSVLEDAQLVSRIAGGDLGEPMEELYRRYAGKLFDTSRGTVSAYLFVIGRSIATDLHRRPSSRPLLPVQDAQVPPQPDSADRIVESLMVRDALSSLTPAHREVLMLCHAGGLTQSQIARRLSLPLGTVKTRMYHGLRALKAALAQRGSNG